MPVSVSPRWAIVASILTVLCVLRPVAAQTCPEALVAAEARYVEGAFGAATEGLDPCLDDTVRSIPARRLIVLSHLQLGEINAAKLAYLRILAIQPAYRPDPVRDPPTYLSLAQVVQAQLAAAPSETAEPATELPSQPTAADVQEPPAVIPPPAAPQPALADLGDDSAEPADPVVTAEGERAGPMLSGRYWIGAGSYGGERGVQSSGPFQEFADNAGFALGVGVSGALTPGVELFGDIEAVRYPTLSRDRGVSAVFDSIDVNRFSMWVRFVTVGVRATAFETRGVSFYGALGGGIASRDERIGGAVSGGVGIDASFGPVMGSFFDATWTFVAPPRAIDAAASESAVGDVFSALRFGLRYAFDT